MQCPNCNGRNPSDARHCLHCGSPFPGVQQKEEKDPNRWLNYVFIGGALFMGSLMLLYGFDTVAVKCTESSAMAEEYEANPEWTRHESEERSWKEREYNRKYGRTNTSEAHKMYPNLKCYSKKTGRVDGVLEKTE